MYTLTQIQANGTIGPWRACKDALGRFPTETEARTEADRRNTTTTVWRHEEAFKQGVQARKRGLGPERCPYHDADAIEAWTEGWWAEDEAREGAFERGYGPGWDCA